MQKNSNEVPLLSKAKVAKQWALGLNRISIVSGICFQKIEKSPSQVHHFRVGAVDRPIHEYIKRAGY